jgi:hypothetical protein
LNKFIKQAVKDNPEPFRGYLEISNATVHTKANKKHQNESQLQGSGGGGGNHTESMLLLDSAASVDLNELLIENTQSHTKLKEDSLATLTDRRVS